MGSVAPLSNREYLSEGSKTVILAEPPSWESRKSVRGRGIPNNQTVLGSIRLVLINRMVRMIIGCPQFGKNAPEHRVFRDFEALRTRICKENTT